MEGPNRGEVSAARLAARERNRFFIICKRAAKPFCFLLNIHAGPFVDPAWIADQVITFAMLDSERAMTLN